MFPSFVFPIWSVALQVGVGHSFAHYNTVGLASLQLCPVTCNSLQLKQLVSESSRHQAFLKYLLDGLSFILECTLSLEYSPYILSVHITRLQHIKIRSHYFEYESCNLDALIEQNNVNQHEW